MKTAKTLPELAATVNDYRARARDYKLPQGLLRMNPNDLSVSLDPSRTPQVLKIAPSQLMHDQLAERLGIPAKYYRKMMDGQRDLLARNVNTWLAESPEEKRLIRTYANTFANVSNGAGGRVDIPTLEQPLTGRAFLGSNYRPLDNYDLMTALVPPMLGAGVKVVSSEITESRLYIQAVAQDIKSRVVAPGTHDRINDILNIGLIASNSEVGGGSLSIRALVFRQVCSKGLVLSEDLPGFKQVHIGRLDADVNGEILSTNTKRLADAAIWSKANDVIKAAITQATLDKITERLNHIAGVALKNPEKAVDIVCERFDLVKDERDAVMRNLISGGDASHWGLTNAVTALANDVASYDRAVELETIGGKVASLSPEAFGNN